MDQVIPGRRLLGVIAPHYPKPGRGRPPLGLEKMLRVYFVQQWFNLSDPAAEDALYDSESIRRFVGVELGDDVVPDVSSILRFRHLLEEHRLTEAVFGAIRHPLIEKGLLVQDGYDRGCDDHRGPQLDEERGRRARSGDAAHPQGDNVVFRDDVPRGD